jgi:hypothetical protein
LAVLAGAEQDVADMLVVAVHAARRRRTATVRLETKRDGSIRAFAVRYGFAPCINFSARRCISSGGTSSTCVATVHVCPNGSCNVPDRSP